MGTSRRTSPGADETELAASADAAPPPPAIDHVFALRNDFHAKLNAIAARVQQRSTQAAAAVMRAINEAQFNVQVAQQERMVSYAVEAQKAAAGADASTALNDLAQRCARDLDEAQANARKAIEDVQARAATAVKDDTEAANREWDNACREQVRALNEWLGQADAASLDPNALAAVGQNLIWVASQMRKPASA